jgi:DNA repair protein RadA/Sms
MKVLYLSGEESTRQIKLRAIRVGVSGESLFVGAVSDLDVALNMIAGEDPGVVVVDSIQTMSLSTLPSSPGSVSQVRECATRLIQMAKQREIPLFLVGHVNKDGAIAGPRVLEHMVDTVLYFEGERHLPYRILRAVKNRYGSTNEIGVFEMGDAGLLEVANPSLSMLSGRPSGVSGSCVACVMEGSRPILSEVQALVCKSSFAVPKRTATGYDFNRISMLIAVLEKRGGYPFSALDAYINIVGGLRLADPAADLPIALSLISNLLDKPIDESLAVFGELGLAGEVRSVGYAQKRISECYRLGYKRVLLPRQSLKQLASDSMPGLELIGIRSIGEARSILG